MEPITRRSFIGLTAGAFAWAACARETDDLLPTPDARRLSLTRATVEVAVGDSRLALALFDGPRPFAPEDTRIEISPPEGAAAVVTPRREPIQLGLGGDDQTPSSVVHELLVVTHDFAVPGFWSATATFTDEGEEQTATDTFEVLEKSTTPMVGEPALRTVSPTVADPLGVDPLCTRRPACSMHELTVEEAVTSGRPSVLVFATPRLCKSRTCGPAVDVIEHVKFDAGDAISFVHVEVYRNLNAHPSNYTEAFAEWRLPGEPWVVFVGSDGIVRDRWSGAVGPVELGERLQTLD